MNCTDCKSSFLGCNEGTDCPHSAQASRDALSLFANPWFWAGGAASLLVWTLLWVLCL